MSLSNNPGRVAGLWYLSIILLGPLRLIYIPNKLFVFENPALTVANIASHERLVRFGVAADLVASVALVMLTLALFRLFKDVDRNLTTQVILFGGVMPAVMYLINVMSDLGSLSIIHNPGGFLASFSQPQRDALVVLLLRLHDHIVTASLMLAGVWLLPLAILTYRSRFLPRFLGVWLFLAAIAWITLTLTGVLAPQYRPAVYKFGQPGFIGEIAFMLWLVIRGARPPAPLTV